MKKIFLVFVLSCTPFTLFAQSTVDIDTFLDGDKLNDSIGVFIKNVSRIIPDSATLQNLWARSPSWKMGWGLGITGSITVEDKKQMGGVLNSKDGFGGSNMDLSKFPSSVPFLPAASIDFRVGLGRLPIDIGFSGLYYKFSNLKQLFGDGTDFTYWTAGADIRGGLPQGSYGSMVPGVFLIGGYYFSSMSLGFAASDTEKVNLDLRNDSYFLALQVSEKLPFVTPFIGFKTIWSKTDSDYSWQSGRPTHFSGTDYSDGLLYEAKGSSTPTLMYLHLYGGASIFRDLVTIAASYNIMTEHFGAELSLRMSNYFFNQKDNPAPRSTPRIQIQSGDKETAAQLARLTKQIEEQKAEIAELNQRLQDMRTAQGDTELAAAGKTEAEKNAEIARLKERISGQEAELALLEKQRDENESKLAGARTSLDETNAELAAAESSLDEARKSIKHNENKKARLASYEAVKYPAGIAYKDIMINGGIGFGTAYTTKMQCPPILVSLDWAVPLFKQPFSLGAQAGFSTESNGHLNTQNYALAFRLAYHFGILDFINDVLPFGKLDLYAALTLGAALEKRPDDVKPHIMIGGLAGAHYYILDNLGVYMEAGYNSMYIYSLGLAL